MPRTVLFTIQHLYRIWKVEGTAVEEVWKIIPGYCSEEMYENENGRLVIYYFQRLTRPIHLLLLLWVSALFSLAPVASASLGLNIISIGSSCFCFTSFLTACLSCIALLRGCSFFLHNTKWTWRVRRGRGKWWFDVLSRDDSLVFYLTCCAIGHKGSLNNIVFLVHLMISWL